MTNEPVPRPRLEPRWPVALAIVSVAVLLELMPGRLRVLPFGFPVILGCAMLVPMAGVALTGGQARWLRLERAVTLVAVVIGEVMTCVVLSHVIRLMLHRPADVSGLQLLSSSVGGWVVNVLLFSLLYWQLDGGGPGGRASRVRPRPDWVFPATGAGDDAPPGWRPSFVDYLFLGFTTATAFSPTDAVPLTSRAKLLMMAEGLLSLVTIVVVASRAINILGN